MSCRCETECMCARPKPEPVLPKFFADLAGIPVGECHESVCRKDPTRCKCRQSPEIAKPGEW